MTSTEVSHRGCFFFSEMLLKFKTKKSIEESLDERHCQKLPGCNGNVLGILSVTSSDYGVSRWF